MNDIDVTWDRIWERASCDTPIDDISVADQCVVLAVRNIFDLAVQRVLALSAEAGAIPVRVVIAGGVFEDGDGYPVDRDDRRFTRVDVYHWISGKLLGAFGGDQREDLIDAFALNGWEPIVVTRAHDGIDLNAVRDY